METFGVADRLKEKIAVITGASRGMGEAIARRFAAEGAFVVMMARSADELERAAAAIGERAWALPCDIADPAAVRDAFATIARRFPGIDVLINNAGLAIPGPIEHADDSAVQTEVGVNILGPLYCCRSAIPLMRARGGGDIINVSSESVRHPYPHLTLYAATKAALEVMSTGLQAELAADGIRVTVYRSGNVRGTFSRDWDPKAKDLARAAAQAAGFYAKSGSQIEADIPAEMMVTLVCLPREARVDLIELRGVLPTPAQPAPAQPAPANTAPGG
jgi:meso-butanediol dehydrogenase/(S,S)-butanediol dehydrogenase/diacetyl reductase